MRGSKTARKESAMFADSKVTFRFDEEGISWELLKELLGIITYLQEGFPLGYLSVEISGGCDVVAILHFSCLDLANQKVRTDKVRVRFCLEDKEPNLVFAETNGRLKRTSSVKMEKAALGAASAIGYAIVEAVMKTMTALWMEEDQARESIRGQFPDMDSLDRFWRTPRLARP